VVECAGYAVPEVLSKKVANRKHFFPGVGKTNTPFTGVILCTCAYQNHFFSLEK
jgi:hypothetical protein